MTQKPTVQLIHELQELATQYGTMLADESHAVRAAKFAHAIGLQDKKMDLHQRLFDTLEQIKSAPKTDAQKEAIKALVTSMATKAQENKQSLEIGFAALERLSGRIMSAVRNATQKTAPSYTAAGKYHQNRKQAAIMRADTTA